MAPRSLRCQGLKQEGDSVGSQRHCCHIPDHKRCSFLRTAQGKYATVVKPYVRDLHRSVLLRNTILHLQDPRRGSQETGLRLAGPQGAPPWQERGDPVSWPVPPQARAAGVDSRLGPPPAFSSPCQDKGQVPSEDSLPDPLPDSFLSTAGEVLEFWESLQEQEVGNGPRSDSTSPSESVAASPVQEAGTPDALCPEEPFCDPLPRSLEILASSCMSDIPSEEFFADIDMSEFESVLWGSPGNGLPTVTSMAGGQAAAENAPLVEAPADASSSRVGSLDHSFEELLLRS